MHEINSPVGTPLNSPTDVAEDFAVFTLDQGEAARAYHDEHGYVVFRGLECRAPALAKGDMLLWNARTIHGSLATNRPEASRSPLTAHFIPESDRFLHRPKDQDRFRDRAMKLLTR